MKAFVTGCAAASFDLVLASFAVHHLRYKSVVPAVPASCSLSRQQLMLQLEFV
jgi:hypothetical protein